jgi:hypothetical protein
VLNLLQGTLKFLLHIAGGIESLSPAQCAAIRDVITVHLGPADVGHEDLVAAIEALESAGLDAWAPISGDPPE